ncbi:hypothetical protein VKT23_001614 [Stygiomarasmius scandens]|uniref:DUF6535 domain-containing protein n=1 Tax=Marasmiellus scandens TaxID=2682957 RepID=A0ABR1K5N0_9AGAR
MSWAEKFNEPESASTRLWQEGDPYRFAPKRRGDPWEQCMKRVDNYDDEMCRGWKEDIDTLLVFAGLFSASSTAFLIESYHWLQDDPGDLTVVLLHQISSQLANATAMPSPSFTPQLFSESPAAVRINTVWFLSLLLSLSTVSLGILCKQWLREHRRDTPTSSPKETLELRQIRSESFEKWGIPLLLAAMPLILQLALVLFFAGVIDLLWNLNYIVAGFCTVVVAASVFVLVWTTVVPAYYLATCPTMIFSDDVPVCPYKSPQAWLFYQFVLLLPVKKLKETNFANWAATDLHVLRNHFPSTNVNARTHLLRGLKWMVNTFSDSTIMANHIFHCLQSFSLEVAAIATRQPEETTKDVIYYNFFRNSSWDPDTGRFLAELFLRQLNSPSQSSRGINDSLGSFWNLAYVDFIGEDTKPELQLELLYQIITSVQNYIADDRITLLDMSPLLIICRKLWNHPNSLVRERSIVLLEEFERWLTSTDGTSSNDLQSTFIPNLASSLTEIIHAESDRSPTSVLICSDRGPRFIRVLNELIVTKGIDIDAYSMQDMPMTWQDAKGKVVRLSGLSHEYFDVLKFPPSSPVQSAEEDAEYGVHIDTATESFQHVPSVLTSDSIPARF